MHANRLIYGIQAVCLGAPTVWMGGIFAALAVIVGLGGIGTMGGIGLLYLAWGVAGLCGLAGWLVLSAAFLCDGIESLERRSGYWWVLLGAGVVAALPLSMALLRGNGWTPDWRLIFMGPALILPALHLAWMRFSARGLAVAGRDVSQE